MVFTFSVKLKKIETNEHIHLVNDQTKTRFNTKIL